MDAVKEFAGPVISLIGAAAPAVSSFINKPKMPTVTTPTPVKNPVMPVKDDATAKAAALKAIAQRASAHGRQSTNLYEKSESLGS